MFDTYTKRNEQELLEVSNLVKSVQNKIKDNMDIKNQRQMLVLTK